MTGNTALERTTSLQHGNISCLRNQFIAINECDRGLSYCISSVQINKTTVQEMYSKVNFKCK